jgi:hypothetical protein
VQINPPQTGSVQSVVVQQMQDLAVIGQGKHWQIRQHLDNFSTSRQVAGGQLTYDEGMSA